MALKLFVDTLIAVWLLEMGAAAAALLALLIRRLARFYPVVCGFLAFDLARSLWLFDLWRLHDGAGYSAFWRDTQPLLIAGYGLLVIEAIFRQASHFPRIGWFATACCAVFAAISALVCLALAGIWISPSIVSSIMATARFYNALCLAVLVLSRGLFGLLSPAMRKNVRTHVWILTGLFAGGVVAAGMMARSAQSPKDLFLIAGQFLTVGCPMAAYVGWLLFLRAGGETFEPIADLGPLLDPETEKSVIGLLTEVRRAAGERPPKSR